jgi:hypothetical protein
MGTREETRMKKNESQQSKPPSQLIDARIKELGDWRGRLRNLVKEADPEVVEKWKWRGVPVWSHDGLICTGIVGCLFVGSSMPPISSGSSNSPPSLSC